MSMNACRERARAAGLHQASADSARFLRASGLRMRLIGLARVWDAPMDVCALRTPTPVDVISATPR
jgi:hypothetical protein